uniref:Uncharacterized protein n=1 Tax=Panagrolaimus davidi TaxID=227884 RepID=A0A914QYW3_9BILA
MLPKRKSSQRKQNGCWPAKVGLTKQQKKAQLYIFYSNRLYGFVFQKKLNKAKCWKCQGAWNYSQKEKCFNEDPELGHRHQECQRLISEIELDQLQRVFLALISGKGLTNENSEVNHYLELFKQLLDEKLGHGTSILYSNYKNFKASIEKSLFDQKDYNEELEKIDRDYIIPEVHGPGQENDGDGQESDFDDGNSDGEEDLERTLQNLEISGELLL